MCGRRNDPTEVECQDCGWKGQRKDMVHDYAQIDEEEVEPIDECPECGSEDVIDIDLRQDFKSDE